MEPFRNAVDIAGIITKFLKNELNESDNQRLKDWLNENPENRALFEKLEDEYFMYQQQQIISQFDAAAALNKFKSSIHKETSVVALKKSHNKWWMVAAAIVILLGSAFYVFILKEQKGTRNIDALSNNKISLQDEIKPGGNNAVLRLSDGTSIELDSAGTGILARQGNMKVIKLSDGKLAYEKTNDGVKKIQYNTIATPRGGQFQLVLSDGTQVWLNAASSLTFPASFTGNLREVKISGEAYFEVAHNPDKPFLVKTGKLTVEVLGTDFNVSAYPDEQNISTTLIQGSVRVKDGAGITIIKPGEQAVVENSSEKISVVKNVNIQSVIAWKEGKFNFQEEDINSIMRKLERWYDINVYIQKDVTNEKFIGVISRNVQLSQILRMLEKTGVVRFSVEGRKVIVK